MLYIIVCQSSGMNQRSRFNGVPFKIKERMALGDFKLLAQGAVNLKK